MSEDSRYLPEEPLVVAAGSTLGVFCREVADWLVSEGKSWSDGQGKGARRPRGGWVIGLWGGRGTGKTSAVMTIMHMLARSEADQQDDDALVWRLPKLDRPWSGTWPVKPPGSQPSSQGREPEPPAHAIFAPADLGQDHLLHALLTFLEKNYACESAQAGTERRKAVRNARLALSRKADEKRYLDLEKELAPSTRQLPARLARVHRKVAETDASLRDAFRDIVHGLQRGCQTPRGSGQSAYPILIPIDDLDLCPNKALELLDALRLYLDLPGVFVVLGADRELLLESLQAGLMERKIEQAGMASAYLMKHVAQQWTLPVPLPEERFKLLMHPEEFQKERALAADTTGDQNQSSSPEPWPPSALAPVLKEEVHKKWLACRLRLELRLEEEKRHEVAIGRGEQSQLKTDFAVTTEDVEQAKASVSMEQFYEKLFYETGKASPLPPTYRGLKTLHNRLTAAWAGLHPREEQALVSSLGLDPDLFRLLLVLIHAADVQFPELGLVTSLSLEPDRAREGVIECASSNKGPRVHELPVASLLDSNRMSGASAGRARQLLAILKNALEGWVPITLESSKPGKPENVQSSEGDRASPVGGPASVSIASPGEPQPPPVGPTDPDDGPTFVGITIRGEQDTLAWARPVLHKLALPEKQIRHFDLRTPGGRNSPEQLGNATVKFWAWWKQQSIRSQVHLAAQAELSFACWVGYALRRRPDVVLYNGRQGSTVFTEYHLPAAELRPLPSYDRFFRLDPGLDHQGTVGAGAVLVSVLGAMTTPWQTQLSRQGTPFRAGFFGQLLTPEPITVTAENLDVLTVAILSGLEAVRSMHDVSHLHLCLRMPLELAFALGRQLNQFRPVSLYEYYDGSYQHVFDLEDLA